MCVRLCDGYYFPLSYAAPLSRLAHDADACAASCGIGARLFYYANPGGRLEDMVDMSGMAYAVLANAYRYRKALVEGCRCEPGRGLADQDHSEVGSEAAPASEAALLPPAVPREPAANYPGGPGGAVGVSPCREESCFSVSPQPIARPAPPARAFGSSSSALSSGDR